MTERKGGEEDERFGVGCLDEHLWLVLTSGCFVIIGRRRFLRDGCFAKPGVFGGTLPVGKWGGHDWDVFYIWVG
jgi:hypothetical protein